MDEVNINKYLSQFNPILIVPVLSAVVGAILVFLFGFKRPNEPRFQTNSSIDSLKKSKRKANTIKTSDNTVSSKQIVGAGKRTIDATASITSKKGSNNEKSSINNNNVGSNNNKKKTDEKKSENASPTKKVTNKKTGKEPVSTTVGNKKQKINKNNSSDGYEKPTDFDDGGWFTVQSKSAKQKNKVDDSMGNQIENPTPKVQSMKNNKTAKNPKVEVKQMATKMTSNELNGAAEVVVAEAPKTEQKFNTEEVPTNEPTAAEIATNDIIDVQEVAPEVHASVPAANLVEVNTVDSSIAFDELGEWTDAKPDRKRSNKKKSRKD